ncbi:MAG: SRPBCC family protein [Actinomycetota bacterium]|nr:SRPBCC family protein [Actinomycetota bacterium]MDQ3911004.1 SRPBCC family protein [Actinomycetota bacterium]
MPQRVESSVVAEAPVSRVYEYWRNLENLPNFMSNIEEVRAMGPDTTHWLVKGPLGARVEFDAQTTQDEENSALGWNSTDGNVETSGQVRFQELGPERTRIEVTMNYADPPGGRVGEIGSRLVSNPQVMLDQDLYNFKEIIEGRATPEEIQQRPAAATVQSGLAAFLTSGTGIAVVGGFILLLLLRRRRGGRSRRRKSRIIFEF